jgi:hypothetical protein
MANCPPVHNLRCLLVSLHVEGEPFRLAIERCHLVQLSHHRFLCGCWPSRRVRSESHVIGKVSHRVEAMTFGHEHADYESYNSFHQRGFTHGRLLQPADSKYYKYVYEDEQGGTREIELGMKTAASQMRVPIDG